MDKKDTVARADELIKKLNLQPLTPEGGYFSFISGFGNNSGTIYYMVTEDSFSHLHVLTDDELWFFLEGDPVVQTTVSQSGEITRTTLEPDNRCIITKAGLAQATRIEKPVLGYALMSTVMSPHFTDNMYTHGKDVSWLREIKEVEDLL